MQKPAANILGFILTKSKKTFSDSIFMRYFNFRISSPITKCTEWPMPKIKKYIYNVLF